MNTCGIFASNQTLRHSVRTWIYVLLVMLDLIYFSSEEYIEDKAGRYRSIKILMVSVRFNLFALLQTEQFLPS